GGLDPRGEPARCPPVESPRSTRSASRRAGRSSSRSHHAVEAALPLADDDRFEAAVAVAGGGELDRADLGDHGPGADAVAAVGAVAALDRVLLVAEMLGHLRLEAG